MAGIPTSNILQPGQISVADGATRALISNMQLIKPSIYNTFTEKYPKLFTNWLEMYGGMEITENQEFSWFENQGKVMQGIQVTSQVVITNGSTGTFTLSSPFYYNNGTQTPLRVKETIRRVATNTEYEILTIPVTTANAFQFTARPKLATTSETIGAGEVFAFGGYVDAGEASTSIDPLAPINDKYTNYCTQIRETWRNTDLAGMTPLWYNQGAGASGMNPSGQLANTGYYTYQGLEDTEIRFMNQTDNKLMIGNLVTNTGLSTTTSQGTQGFIPKILQDGETVGVTPGTLDIAKLHEITRIMNVNGCAMNNLWLMDMFMRQNFSDTLFAAYPAGAFAWGSKTNSEEAAIAYGTKSINIDDYQLQVKLRKEFNSEYTIGLTPTVDRFRYFGIICPLSGETPDGRDPKKKYRNMQIMMQIPPKGGTTGNGIRVWEHGGASVNPTNGTMTESVEYIAYKGSRITAANQFIVTQS